MLSTKPNKQQQIVQSDKAVGTVCCIAHINPMEARLAVVQSFLCKFKGKCHFKHTLFIWGFWADFVWAEIWMDWLIRADKSGLCASSIGQGHNWLWPSHRQQANTWEDLCHWPLLLEAGPLSLWWPCSRWAQNNCLFCQKRVSYLINGDAIWWDGFGFWGDSIDRNYYLNWICEIRIRPKCPRFKISNFGF